MNRLRRPAVLVLNPTSDQAFRRDVDEAIEAGASSPEALAEALRAAYPRLVVRRRELSAEPQAVWYVYRDGAWRSALAANDARDDYRAASESLADDAARVHELEERSAALNDDDPNLEDLTQQSDDLTRDMAAKSARQSGLLKESRRAAGPPEAVPGGDERP